MLCNSCTMYTLCNSCSACKMGHYLVAFSVYGCIMYIRMCFNTVFSVHGILQCPMSRVQCLRACCIKCTLHYSFQCALCKAACLCSRRSVQSQRAVCTVHRVHCALGVFCVHGLAVWQVLPTAAAVVVSVRPGEPSWPAEGGTSNSTLHHYASHEVLAKWGIAL